MAGKEQTPPPEKSLSEAVKTVSDLYRKFYTEVEFYEPGHKLDFKRIRKESWEKAAEENREFGETIRKLGETLEYERGLKIKNDPSIIEKARDQANVYFNEVPNEPRKLLHDILSSRITSPKKNITKIIFYGREKFSIHAGKMIEEMGFENGWKIEEPDKITLEQVVGKVLTKELKFGHTPHPKKLYSRQPKQIIH